MIIKNATILNEQFKFQLADLVLSDTIDQIIPKGKIEEKSGGTSSDKDILDLQGDLLIPGLIDIHTHGAVGVDAMDENLNYEKWRNYLLENGITTFFPATVTGDFDKITKALKNLQQAAGVYLEGPFLNAEKNGAHDKTLICPADPDFIETIKDKITVIAIAPEIEGNMDVIKSLVSKGILVTIAHSSADYMTGREAYANGATLLTHTFNAMNPLTHREPNLIGAALENDKVFCEAISDGVHVHPAVIKILYRILGPRRMLLISDSMAATGYPDGEYLLGNLKVIVKDHIAHTEYGAIAGSTTNLMGMVRKAVSFGLPLEDVIQMATLTPARATGLDNVKGSIAAGKKADLIWCKRDLTICGVIKDGVLVPGITCS